MNNNIQEKIQTADMRRCIGLPIDTRNDNSDNEKVNN